MDHPKLRHIYVGVDTHKKTHTAVIIDGFCDKLGEITIENKPSEFEKLITEVNKYLGVGKTPIFGLEDTDSSGRALAMYLVKSKYTVKKVNSTLSYSERSNQSTLHKDDSYDAFCVAKVLVNKLYELPDADPKDIYWTLSMIVGRRDALVKDCTALKNQLHTYIVHHYPSYKKFFSTIDSKSALAFWERYPSPSRLKGVTAEELGKLLNDNSSGYFGQKKAEQILETVKADGDTQTELQDIRDNIVSITVRQLRQNDEEIALLEEQIKKVMDKLGYKLETMIGVKLVTAAALVSQIGDIRRFSNESKLARYAGIAPVKYASGEKQKNFKNKQGDRALYGIIYSIAARQICCGRNKDKPVNGIFYEYYKKKMTEGKTKHQALICVMRRLVKIIYGMMKNKTEYIYPTLSSGQA